MIAAEMGTRASAQWAAEFDTAGVPCAPVQDVGQMLEHAQTRALGLLQPVPGSSIPLIALPVRFDGERSKPRSAPPALGEYTQSVLGKVATK